MNQANNDHPEVIEIPDDLVSIKLCSEQIGISISFLKKLLKNGMVKRYRLGEKRVLVSPRQVRMATTPQLSN